MKRKNKRRKKMKIKNKIINKMKIKMTNRIYRKVKNYKTKNLFTVYSFTEIVVFQQT